MAALWLLRLTPEQGCVILYSHNTSHHPGVEMGTRLLNDGG